MKKTTIASQYSHRIAHQIPYHLPTMACADLDSEWSEYNHTGNGFRIESYTESPRGLEHSLNSQLSSKGAIYQAREKAQQVETPSVSSDTTPYIQRELSRKIWARYFGRNGR